MGIRAHACHDSNHGPGGVSSAPPLPAGILRRMAGRVRFRSPLAHHRPFAPGSDVRRSLVERGSRGTGCGVGDDRRRTRCLVASREATVRAPAGGSRCGLVLPRVEQPGGRFRGAVRVRSPRLLARASCGGPRRPRLPLRSCGVSSRASRHHRGVRGSRSGARSVACPVPRPRATSVRPLPTEPALGGRPPRVGRYPQSVGTVDGSGVGLRDRGPLPVAARRVERLAAPGDRPGSPRRLRIPRVGRVGFRPQPATRVARR